MRHEYSGDPRELGRKVSQTPWIVMQLAVLAYIVGTTAWVLFVWDRMPQ